MIGQGALTGGLARFRCQDAFRRLSALLSASRASAAIQPDIITIGMPGPGWAAPPAR